MASTDLAPPVLPPHLLSATTEDPDHSITAANQTDAATETGMATNSDQDDDQPSSPTVSLLNVDEHNHSALAASAVTPTHQDAIPAAALDEDPATTTVSAIQGVNEQAEPPISRPTSPLTDTRDNINNPSDATDTTDASDEDKSSANDDVPSWVTWEEDYTTPTEEELKEVEEEEIDKDATNIAAQEKYIFPTHDDPEQRPIKKIRLSWVIQGVRGTKDQPNKECIMRSPPVLIDGLYWQIKFFPRGNKNSYLSAYIQCTREKPTQVAATQKSTLKHFEGPPESDLGNDTEPKTCITTGATPLPETTPSTDSTPSTDVVPTNNETTSEAKDSTYLDELLGKPDGEDYRVSAQLGMVIYNPTEPRTATRHSSEHQFCPNNSDWGWTKFVPNWERIHVRQRGERQPLLRDDIIAIDAYIRIFEDRTQALWWHASDDCESEWPSKLLSGYFPTGTPPLYHSPAVAGITALLLLKPFRNLLQTIDCGQWRTNSLLKPRPFIAMVQATLHLMRHLQRDTYVNLHPIIEALHKYGESFHDVKSFWERFRRAIELELDEDEEAKKTLSSIFDAAEHHYELPPLPVRGAADVQAALSMLKPPERLAATGPDFLPLMLDRDVFDRNSRQWKMHNDRIKLNDQITLPFGEKTVYTLYGFVVHFGERNSGRFYSILRPGGPDTKWLAFEDGDGNKVFSYSRTEIDEFEGLVDTQNENADPVSRAYMAMYVKADRADEYFSASLEDFKAPRWLQKEMSHWDSGMDLKEPEASDESATKRSEIAVEIFCDKAVTHQRGLLDMFNVKQMAREQGDFRSWSLPRTTTYQELRHKYAEDAGIDNPEKLRLFSMHYGEGGQYIEAHFTPVRLENTLDSALSESMDPVKSPLCLWLSILETEEDIKRFGHQDVVTAAKLAEKDLAKANEILESSTILRSIDAVTETSHASSSEQRQTHATETVESIAPVIADEFTGSEYAVEVQTTARTTAPGTATAAPPAPPEDPELQLAVTHGHLIDAILGFEQDESQQNVVERVRAASIESQQSTVQLQDTSLEDEAAIIAALIAADAAEIFGRDSDGPEMNDATPTRTEAQATSDEAQSTPMPPVDQHAFEDSSTNAAGKDSQQAPTVYGFIQIFDVELQDFRAHGTFFARDEPVKEALRKRMGYSKDREFNLWYRTSATEGITVSGDSIFSDINGIMDGVDVIIGDVLSAEKKTELRLAGKNSDPFELSLLLRLEERRSPDVMTPSPIVERYTYGQTYFKGPMVNRRCHGPDCVQIYSNGNVYEGPVVQGQRHGDAGKLTQQNGDVYEGGFKRDEFDGQGTLVQKRTGNKYVGGFREGKRYGRGTTYWEVADEQAGACQICYDQDIDALFYDCGHVCSCMECAKQCDVCPICRKNVQQVVKMYMV